MVFGIDPGPSEHAIVGIDGITVAKFDEHSMLERFGVGDVVAYEQFAPFAHSIDDGSMRTIFETGRLVERIRTASVERRAAIDIVGIRRQQAKLYLVGSARCGDAQVRAALIERFGPTKQQAVGTRGNPGPLFGITSHHWAALAIAVTATSPTETMLARRLSWTT